MNLSRWMLGGFTIGCMLASALLAEESNGRIDKALVNGSNDVWYDAREKSLVFPAPAALQASEDDLKDRHQFVYDPPPKTAGNSAWWDWFKSLGEFLAGSVRWILMILITAIVIGMAVYLWLAIKRGWYSPARRNQGQTNEIERDQAKIVDLPFNIDMPVHGLLDQAEAFRRNGDYSRAIIYLFSHVLVELDNADCIRLQRGKTNRVYLRELKNEPRLAELHQYLMQLFEAVFFGRYMVNREQCDRCWSLLPYIAQATEEAKQRRVASEEANASIAAPISRVASLGLLLMLGIVGCNRNPPLPTDAYGSSNYGDSQKSVSGLSVLRALCEENGLRTFELKSLSHRSQKVDAILWAPKDFHLPTPREMAWFDEWLSGDAPRTLIFVGRDYSPASHYWQQAAAAAAPEDRRTFRLRQAYVDVEMDVARSEVDPTVDCDWFSQRLDHGLARRVEKFQGPWSHELNADETHVVLRGSLNAKTDERSVTRSTVGEAVSTYSPSPSRLPESDADVDFEITQVEYGAPTIDTLLKSADGTPIITSISYEPWGSGRLILIANGSVLLNESLAMRGNQQLAERIVTECVPNGRIGFLSNVGETWIRDPWDEQEPIGFELLRVWPLSLISMQGLFLGFIALLAMLPIFGRPQRLPSRSTTDFGKHIEALGDLLLRSRDRNYALQRIADYFREVRRDTASPWSLVAPVPDSILSEPLSATPTTLSSLATAEPLPVTPEPIAPSNPNSMNHFS